MKRKKVLFIVGPTAVGKTETAIELARKLDGEIISADSRQIYRYMDIGTAKPTPEQRRQVPHHFIDIKNPDEYYSAGEFSREARQKIHDLLNRGIQPIVVGGSGLYIRALVDGIFEPKVADPEVKERLTREARKKGIQHLHKRLSKIDPETAQRLPATDTQRIIRALEVYELTGKPFSEFLKHSPKPADFTAVFFGLTRERQKLYKRINERVDRMIEEGLVEEVKKLHSMGYGPHLNALRTVGYREVFEYLAGELSYDEMIELIKQHSRNYAKRQLTWFRKEKRIRWLNLEDFKNTEEIVDFIFEKFRTTQ